MESVTPIKEMSPLITSLNSLIQKGYSEDYTVTEEGLKSLKTGKLYQPDQVKVVDFNRFEGISDPADESILYAIETNDGSKGTLVDAFGPSSDPQLNEFMQKVEKITKDVQVK